MYLQARTRPEFGGCFAFCLVRGGMVVACFHYMVGRGLACGERVGVR